jgi:uracil phosphoribosyltransferase
MIHVSTHPLVKHKVARLRDVATEPKAFRELVGELAQLLVYEATVDLPTAVASVRTPLGDCQAEVVKARVGIIPILRAGLGMAEAMLRMMPGAVVWHLGLYRDHATHQPITYYNKLPPEPNIDVGLIVDPMLATGGSASAAIRLCKEQGARRVTMVALVAAPAGVARLEADHPDVEVVVAALDRELDDQGFILPGLGDAGDRLYGTR